MIMSLAPLHSYGERVAEITRDKAGMGFFFRPFLFL